MSTWSVIEWMGTVSSMVCVFLGVREHVGCWPIGLVSVVLYTAFFFHIKLYSNAVLHIFYFFTNLVGWRNWVRRGASGDTLQVSRLRSSERWHLVYLITIPVLIVSYLSARYTDANVPLWDTTVTGLSVAAQFLMIQKKFETWILWLITDIVGVSLYLYKQTYPTAFLYLVFVGLAWHGLRTWKRKIPT